jgi:hypothetical protein
MDDEYVYSRYGMIIAKRKASEPEHIQGWVESDLDAELLGFGSVSSGDERFISGPQLIFGNKVGVEQINYSDRLFYQKHEQHEAALAKLSNRAHEYFTARWKQDYLSLVFDRPVQIVWIALGMSAITQNPYYIYGYNYVKNDDQTKQDTQK